VRLVKYCLHCRGLPLAAEGGIPSLAWSLIAFSCAFRSPADTSIHDLFGSFLKEMQRLSDHALHLRWHVTQDTLYSDSLEWHFRGGSDVAWAEDWLQLITVDDCHETFGHDQLADSRPMTITPRFVSAALALLYIIEFRLAWHAFLDGDWNALWRTPMQARPSLNRMTGDGKLHVVLIHGEVYVGKVRSVQFQPGLKRGNALHHRDQTCHLSLQEVVLKKDSKSCSDILATERKRNPMIWCQPCNWVCALPLSVHTRLQPEGLFRLAEIFQVVGITRVSHDLCDTVLAWKQSLCLKPDSDQIAAGAMAINDAVEDTSTQEDVVVSESPLYSQDGSEHVESCEEPTAEKKDFNVDFEEEDSTRASESECETRGTNLSISELMQVAKSGTNAMAERTSSGCDTKDWKPSLRHTARIVGAESLVPKVAVAPGNNRLRCREVDEWRPSLRHRSIGTTRG